MTFFLESVPQARYARILPRWVRREIHVLDGGSAQLAGKFTHNNDPFTCLACGQLVPPRSVGCRNHCPFCLCSRHVDLYPGDRSNVCQGLMRAYGYEVTSKKGLVLLFRCERCGAETRNVSAYEDDQAPDDYDLILKLKTQPPGSRG